MESERDMKQGSRRMVVVIASSIATLFVVAMTLTAVQAGAGAPGRSGQAGPTSTTPGAQGPQLAGQAFKNVQALKDISVDDFMLTMGIMTSSLGFDCADCHEGAGTDKVNWAADTPRKVTARRMVNMVTAINRDYFAGRQLVTCWACHRNRDRPLVTPLFDIVYGMPSLEQDDLVLASSAGVPKPDEVIDKYLRAIGGPQRLSTLTSYAATGSSIGFGGFGGGGRVEIFGKAPDQRSTIIKFPDAPGRDASVRSFDGKIGWIKTPLSVLGEYQVSGSELDGARLDAQLAFPSQIKQVLKNMRTLDSETIDGKDCDVVQADGQRRMFITLFFERSTGYLIRSIRYGPSPIGRIPTQVDYSDYRDVNGIKMPFRFTFTWLDGRDAFQLSQIQANVPIDSAKFGRPTALEDGR
jgi:photosynthetic reaction center cytochrome c subunit